MRQTQSSNYNQSNYTMSNIPMTQSFQPGFGMSQYNQQLPAINRRMHPDSTTFKNTPQDSSVASHGILRKNVSQLSRTGLGLNPNIRVEDEYVDNLMKQIHFMNLEIHNLRKQKQEENKDVVGITALLQRDQRQHTDHVIEAKDKFGELIMDMKKSQNKLEEEVFRHQEVNNDLEMKLRVNKEMLDLSRKKYDDMVHSFDQEIQKIREKLDTDGKNREEITAQILKIKRNLDQAKIENEKLKKHIGEKNLISGIKREIDEADNKILVEEIAFKSQVLDELKLKKKEKEDELNQNKRLVDLKKINQELTDQFKEKEKELHSIDYKCLQMEHLQKLAIDQKEVDADKRRRLFEEVDKLKTILEETEKSNRLKVEKKIRDNESVELGKLDAILRKEQGLLNEARVRYERVHEEFKKFKLDYYRKEQLLGTLIAKNEKDTLDMDDYEKTIKDLEPTVDGLKVSTGDLESKIEDLSNERNALLQKIKVLKEEHSGLNQRIEFIRTNFDLDKLLQEVNLEGLKGVMNSNININTTITDLLNKWDGIKRFGKGVDPNIQGGK